MAHKRPKTGIMLVNNAGIWRGAQAAVVARLFSLGHGTPALTPTKNALCPRICPRPSEFPRICLRLNPPDLGPSGYTSTSTHTLRPPITRISYLWLMPAPTPSIEIGGHKALLHSSEKGKRPFGQTTHTVRRRCNALLPRRLAAAVEGRSSATALVSSGAC
jgi:hypothetical protein